jgi:hypothetical protein
LISGFLVLGLYPKEDEKYLRSPYWVSLESNEMYMQLQSYSYTKCYELRPQLATWQKTFIHTSLRNLLIIFSPGKSKNKINLTKAISTATVTQLSKDQTLTKQNKFYCSLQAKS